MLSVTTVLQKYYQFDLEDFQLQKACCAKKTCETVVPDIPSPKVHDVFIEPAYKSVINGKAVPIKHETICESLLCNSTNVMVVSGEVGTGKSTVLKQLAYKWSVDTMDSLWFVLHVDCAKIPRKQMQVETFVDLLKNYRNVDESTTKVLECFCANSQHEKSTDLKKNVLFLLDNFDQYINSFGITFCDELNVMLGMAPGNSDHINKWRIIVFTRPHTLLKMFKHDVTHILHYTLQGFCKKAIARSLQANWCNVKDSAMLEDVSRWHKSLPKQERRAIRKVPPLLFALRDYVHIHGQLPDSISVIFHYAREFMLKQTHRLLWWQRRENVQILYCSLRARNECSGIWCKPVAATRAQHDIDSNLSHYSDCNDFLKKWLQDTAALKIITYTHYNVNEIVKVTDELCPHLILESGIFTAYEDAKPDYVKAINQCFFRYIVAVYFRKNCSDLSYKMFKMPLKSPDLVQTGFEDIGDGVLLQSTLTIRIMLFLEMFFKLPDSGSTTRKKMQATRREKAAKYACRLISKQGSSVYVQLLPPLRRIANACIHAPTKEFLNDFIHTNSTFQVSQDHIHENVMVYLSESPTFSTKHVMFGNFCFQVCVCTPKPAKFCYFVQQKDKLLSKPVSQLQFERVEFFAYCGTLLGLFELLRSTTFSAVHCLISLTDGEIASTSSKSYVLTRRCIHTSLVPTALVTALFCKITSKVELMIVDIGENTDETHFADCDNKFSFFDRSTINNYFFSGTLIQFCSLHEKFVHISAKRANIYINSPSGIKYHWELEMNNLANSSSVEIINSLCGLPLTQGISLPLTERDIADYNEFSLMENTYSLRKIGCLNSGHCRVAIITHITKVDGHCAPRWAGQVLECQMLAFTGSLLDLGLLLSANEVSTEATVYYRSMQPEPMSEVKVSNTPVQLPNKKHIYIFIIVSCSSDRSILLGSLFCTRANRKQHVDGLSQLNDTLSHQCPKILQLLMPDITELMMCIAHKLLPHNAEQVLLNIDPSLTFPNNKFRLCTEYLWLRNEIVEMNGQYFESTLCRLNATTPIALVITDDATAPNNCAAKNLGEFEDCIAFVLKPEQLAAVLRKNVLSSTFKSSKMYLSLDKACSFGHLSHNVWCMLNSRSTVIEILFSSNQKVKLAVYVENYTTVIPENALCMSDARSFRCDYIYYAGSAPTLCEVLTNRPVKATNAEFHMYNMIDGVDRSEIIARIAPIVATNIDTRVCYHSLQLPPEDLKLELARLILNEHYWLCMVDNGTLCYSTSTPLSADDFGNLLQLSKPSFTIFRCMKQFLQFLSSDIGLRKIKDLTVVIAETTAWDESQVAALYNEGTIRIYSMNEPEWCQIDNITYKFYYSFFETHSALFILASHSTGPSTKVPTHRQLTSISFSGTVETFANLVANRALPAIEKNVYTFYDIKTDQYLHLVSKKSELYGYVVDQFIHNDSNFILSIVPSTRHQELQPKDLEPTVSASQNILYVGDRDNLERLLETVSFNIGQHYAKLTHITTLQSMLVVWTTTSTEARLRSKLVILQNVNVTTAKSAELIFVTMPSQDDMKFTEANSYNLNKSTITVNNFTNVNEVNKFTFSGTLRNFILLLATRTGYLSITVGSFIFLTQWNMQGPTEVINDKLMIIRDCVFVSMYPSLLDLFGLKFNKLSLLHLEEDCRDKSNYKNVDSLVQISSEIDILSFSGSIDTYFCILFDFLNMKRDVIGIHTQFTECDCFANVGQFAANRDQVHLYNFYHRGALMPASTMLPGRTFNYAELFKLNEVGHCDRVALLIKGTCEDLLAYFAIDIYRRLEEHSWTEVSVVFDGDRVGLLELLLLLKVPQLVVYTRSANPSNDRHFYSMQTTYNKNYPCKGLVCADMQYTDRLPTDTATRQFRIVQEIQTPDEFPLKMCTTAVPTIWRISCATLLGIYERIQNSWQCLKNQYFHVCMAKEPGTLMISPRCEPFCTTRVKLSDFSFVCMGLLDDTNAMVVSLTQQAQAGDQNGSSTRNLHELFPNNICPIYVHLEASFSSIYNILPVINERKDSVKSMHITLKPECIETTAEICYPKFKQAGHISTNDFTTNVLNWKLLIRTLKLNEGIVMHLSQGDDTSEPITSEDFTALHDELRDVKLLCYTGQWDAFITFYCQKRLWQADKLDKLWVNFTNAEDAQTCCMPSAEYNRVRSIRLSNDYSVIPFQNEADNAVKFSVIVQNHNLVKFQHAALTSKITEILAEQEQWCYNGATDGLLNLLANARQVKASNFNVLLSPDTMYFVSHYIHHYCYNADSNGKFDIFDIKQRQHNSYDKNIIARFVKEGEFECPALCKHSPLSWPVQRLEVFGSVDLLLTLVRRTPVLFGEARFMIRQPQHSETHEITLNGGEVELKSGCEYSVANWQALMQNGEMVLLDVCQSPHNPTDFSGADILHKKHFKVFTYCGGLGFLARLFVEWDIFAESSTICLNDINKGNVPDECNLAQTQLCVTEHNYNVRILRQNEICVLFLMYSVSEKVDGTCIEDSSDLIPDCTYLYAFCGYIEDFASIVVNGQMPKKAKMHYLVFKDNTSQLLSFDYSLQLSTIVEHQCINNSQFEVFSVHNKHPHSGNNLAFVYVVERATTTDVQHFDQEFIKCDILVLNATAKTVGRILRQFHSRIKTLTATDAKTKIYVCRSNNSRQVVKVMQIEHKVFSVSPDAEPNFFYEGDVYSWFDERWSLMLICASSMKSTAADYRATDCEKCVNIDKFTSFDWFEYFGPINHFAICFSDRRFTVPAGGLKLTDLQEDIGGAPNILIDCSIHENLVSVDTVQAFNAGLRLTHICIDSRAIAAALLINGTAAVAKEEIIYNRGDSEAIPLVYVGPYAKLSTFLSQMRDYQNYKFYIRTNSLFLNDQMTHNEDSFGFNAVCRVVNCTNHMPQCKQLWHHNKILARLFYLNQADFMNNTSDTLDIDDHTRRIYKIHLVGTLRQLIFNLVHNKYPKHSSDEYLLQLLPDDLLVFASIFHLDQDGKNGLHKVIHAKITADYATINHLYSLGAAASSVPSVQHLHPQQGLQTIIIEVNVNETFLTRYNFLLVQLCINSSTRSTAFVKGNDDGGAFHKNSNTQENADLEFVVKDLENVPLLYYVGDAKHLCTLLQYPEFFRNVGNVLVSLSEESLRLQESFESLELCRFELICSNKGEPLQLLALVRNSKPPLDIVAASVRSEVAERARGECKFQRQIDDINYIANVYLCGSPMVFLNNRTFLGKCGTIQMEKLQYNRHYSVDKLMTNINILSNSSQLFSTTDVFEDLTIVQEDSNVPIVHNESIDSESTAKQVIFVGTEVGLCVWLLKNSNISTVSFYQSSTPIFHIPSGSYDVLIEGKTEWNIVRLQDVSATETYFYYLKDKSTPYTEKPKEQSLICVNSMTNLVLFILSLNVSAERDLPYKIIAPDGDPPDICCDSRLSRSKCQVKSFVRKIIGYSVYDMHAIETKHGTLRYFCNGQSLKGVQKVRRKVSKAVETITPSRRHSEADMSISNEDDVVCAYFVLYRGSVRHFIRFFTDKNVKLQVTVRLYVYFNELKQYDWKYIEKKKKITGCPIESASIFFDARSQPPAADAVMQYLAPLLRLNENQHYFVGTSRYEIVRNASISDSISDLFPGADNRENSSTSTDRASTASNSDQTGLSPMGELPSIGASQDQQMTGDENVKVCASEDANQTTRDGERHVTSDGTLVNNNE